MLKCLYTVVLLIYLQCFFPLKLVNFIYSQNTRTFPLPVLKLVLYFSNIASISETRSVIL